MNHVICRFPSFEILKGRDDVVFDLLDYIWRNRAIVPHDLLETSERVIRKRVPAQGVKIVRDVICHDAK